MASSSSRRSAAKPARPGSTSRSGSAPIELARSLGKRRYEDINEVLTTGPTAEQEAYARSVCTPNCPYFDHVKEFYGQTDPSYETVATFTGGTGSTRYFFSGLCSVTSAASRRTRARSARRSAATSISRSAASCRWPSRRACSTRTGSAAFREQRQFVLVADLRARLHAEHFRVEQEGRSRRGSAQSVPLGTNQAANPFDLRMQNDEDIYRVIAAGRLTYNAVRRTSTLELDARRGNRSLQQRELRLLPAVHSVAATRIPARWHATRCRDPRAGYRDKHELPGQRSSQHQLRVVERDDAAGVQQSAIYWNSYSIIGRGLGPQQVNSAGVANTAAEQRREQVINQA